MSATKAVFERELKAYFGTPLAYVFLAIFLFACSQWMYSSNFWLRQEASLAILFSRIPTIFAIFAPLVAMRMWAEERRTGTIEMLLTLPVTIKQAMLGKFLAGWVFMLISLFCLLPILFVVMWMGDPELGPVFAGFFGAGLLAAAYLAISSFFSVLTKSQVISFVLSMAACLILNFCGDNTVVAQVSNYAGERVASFVETLSLVTQFDVMQRGLIEIRSVLFMLVITVGALAASIVMLEDRKAA